MRIPKAQRAADWTRGPGLAGTLVLALALAGCASRIPQTIRTAPAQPLTVAQAQQSPDRLKGQRVRWGGSIVSTVNLAQTTEIEVLSRPLDREGEPRTWLSGEGRFIARVSGFVDPAEYAKDRELTVEGPLMGLSTRKVGDYPYAYPVVAAETRYLWPQTEPPSAYPYPWPWGWSGYGPWRGPWGGPWGNPWGPGPYGPWWEPW